MVLQKDRHEDEKLSVILNYTEGEDSLGYMRQFQNTHKKINKKFKKFKKTNNNKNKCF